MYQYNLIRRRIDGKTSGIEDVLSFTSYNYYVGTYYLYRVDIT